MPYPNEERQCKCPVAFPENPALKTQVHRYNCMWVPDPMPSRALIAGCREYWIQDTPFHLHMARYYLSERMRELWVRYSAHVCLKIMVSEALLER